MNHLPSFSEFLNESHVDKYYDIKWARKNEKDVYDHHIKIIDTAEQAMPVLAETLDRLFPGKFDTSNIGFAFRGNAAFLFCDVPDRQEAIKIDQMLLSDERNSKSDYSKYFDMGGMNDLSDGSRKLYSHYFRLKAY